MDGIMKNIVTRAFALIFVLSLVLSLSFAFSVYADGEGDPDESVSSENGSSPEGDKGTSSEEGDKEADPEDPSAGSAEKEELAGAGEGEKDGKNDKNEKDDKSGEKTVKSKFEPFAFVKNLKYMGIGMLGIFIVIGIIIICISLLNKIFSRAPKSEQ